MCDHCDIAALDPDGAAWPLCAIPGCDNEVDPRRFYHIRSTCTERHANTARTVHIINMPKSNPIVTSSLAIAKGIGASHKGNRQAF